MRDGALAPAKYVDGRKGGFDPHARIPDMDLDGIDAAFLYPTLGLFAGAVQDPELAGALWRAYNRWLADYCQPHPERLFGVAILPMQSVELAVDELRYARTQSGMRAGFIRPNPTTACSMTWHIIRSGPRRRISTLPSAYPRGPAACRRPGPIA
jgi:predicted TIM-barrel fold metal-dependent hydrolase